MSDREEAKKFLYEHLKNYIKGDIEPLLKDKCDGEEIGGYFSVIALVFTLIEYLGRLRYKNSETKNGAKHATAWIREYMGRCNKRYADLGGLLFDMYRHGIIHTREPKQYLYALNKGFSWEIVKNERQEEHLTIYKGRNFIISLNQLVSDLETAIDYFWKDLNTTKIVEDNFYNTYLELKMPQLVQQILLQKQYLKKDFEVIEKELIPW